MLEDAKPNRIPCVLDDVEFEPLQTYFVNPEFISVPSNVSFPFVSNPNFRGKGLVKIIVEWSKNYATENGKKFVRMDTVGENLKLIEHYTACGFDFLGLSQLTNTDGLPQHYHNAVVSLFELKV